MLSHTKFYYNQSKRHTIPAPNDRCKDQIQIQELCAETKEASAIPREEKKRDFEANKKTMLTNLRVNQFLKNDPKVIFPYKFS